MSIPFMAQAATYPDGGALYYSGGQNDNYVFSSIKDRKNEIYGYYGDDGKNYAVVATVKVGSTTYTSGWKIAEAYKSANRVWYANESSHYDYKRISTTYTDSNWGSDY